MSGVVKLYFLNTLFSLSSYPIAGVVLTYLFHYLLIFRNLFLIALLSPYSLLHIFFRSFLLLILFLFLLFLIFLIDFILFRLLVLPLLLLLHSFLLSSTSFFMMPPYLFIFN